MASFCTSKIPSIILNQPNNFFDFHFLSLKEQNLYVNGDMTFRQVNIKSCAIALIREKGAIGRVTARLLQMNRQERVEERRLLAQAKAFHGVE
jgi:hypothetical protein